MGTLCWVLHGGIRGVFQGSLAVAIILIDGSDKLNPQLGFELQSSRVIERRNNVLN